MATSPVNLLLEYSERERDHETSESKVDCIGRERDGKRTAKIKISTAGKYMYASMSETEVATLLPTILAFSESSSRVNALSAYFAKLPDREALELLSILLQARNVQLKTKQS